MSVDPLLALEQQAQQLHQRALHIQSGTDEGNAEPNAFVNESEPRLAVPPVEEVVSDPPPDSPFSDPSFVDVDGTTAMHEAVLSDRLHRLSILVHHQAIDQPNAKGQSPLFYAAALGKVKCCLKLLDLGASFINAATGRSVCDAAIEAQQADVLKAVWKHPQYTLLLKNGSTDIAEPTVASSMDAKQKLPTYSHAIIARQYQTAIECKSLPMLQELVAQHYSDRNAADSINGLSAVHRCIQNWKEGLAYLGQSKVDVLSPSAKQKSAWEYSQNIKSNLAGIVENRAKQQKLASEHRKQNVESVVKFLHASAVVHKRFAHFMTSEHNVTRVEEALRIAINKLSVTTFDELCEKQLQAECAAELLSAMTTAEYDSNAPLIKRSIIKGKIFDRPKLANCVESVINNSIVQQLEKKKRIEEESRAKGAVASPTSCSSSSSSSSSSFSSFPLTTGVASGVLTAHQQSFCRRFETDFDEAYSLFRALNSGDVVEASVVKEERMLEAGKAALAGLPNIPTPFPVSIPVGAALSGAVSVYMFFRSYIKKKQAARIIKLFSSVSPYERCIRIRCVAEAVAEMYYEQIEHLEAGSGGTEQFASCAVARAVAHILSSDDASIDSPSFLTRAGEWLMSLDGSDRPRAMTAQKDLLDIFLVGITTVSSSFDADTNRLRTINGQTEKDDWNALGIFQNTGVRFNGERYATANCGLDKYGYCNGTQLQINNRVLQKRNGQNRWPPGRQFSAEVAQPKTGS